MFEDKPPLVERIVYLATGSAGSMCTKQLDPSPRLLPTFFLVDKTLVWFDGASQRNGTICGAGGIIKTSGMTSYIWTLNCGQGSNT